MSGIGGFFAYMLIAVFAQNAVFTALGSPQLTLQAVRRPKTLAIVSGLVSLFAILVSLTVLPFDYLMPIWTAYLPLRGFMVSVAALIWYRLISGLVSKIAVLEDNISELVPMAALSSIVVGLPMLLSINVVIDPVHVIGMALGTGAGFWLAAQIVYAGLRRSDNPDIPPALRGAPMMLIYIGIIAMAFSAFGGGLDLFR